MPQQAESWYEIARIDAAIVASLRGRDPEPFWVQAYAWVIARVKTAADIAGRKEPDLRAIAALLTDDDAGLHELVGAAARTAGNTDDAGRDPGLQDWFDKDWNGLDPKLQESIRKGLQTAADSDLTVRPSKGPHRGTAIPIGRRRGPWRDWDTTTLPRHTRLAIRAATDELRGEDPNTAAPANTHIARHDPAAAAHRAAEHLLDRITDEVDAWSAGLKAAKKIERTNPDEAGRLVDEAHERLTRNALLDAWGVTRERELPTGLET